jgi:hypothetical protein
MRFHHFAALLLLPAAAFCGDYQVVFKDSGKVIHGGFVQEDAKTITLIVGDTEVSFRKEALDLKRMRELNSAADVPSASSVGQPQLPSRGVGLATIGKLKRQIEEREETLARYEAQPPSAARDRKIHEAEEELRLMRNAREDLRLEYGMSENSELLRLRKISDEAFAEAEEAQREYDSLPPNTSQAQAAIKWERFQSAEKKWQEAHAALLKALQEEADRTRSRER